MGFYVNVKAKKGCEKQINEAWSSKFGDVLVYTKEIIKKPMKKMPKMLLKVVIIAKEENVRRPKIE